MQADAELAAETEVQDLQQLEALYASSRDWVALCKQLVAEHMGHSSWSGAKAAERLDVLQGTSDVVRAKMAASVQQVLKLSSPASSV
jgi:hypothetical protein